MKKCTCEGRPDNSLIICGDFCKYLSPDRQKELIEDAMIQEQGSLQLRSTNGKEGDKRFLVSSTWWRKWADYVNFDAPTPRHKTMLSSEGTHSATEVELYARPSRIENYSLLQ